MTRLRTIRLALHPGRTGTVWSLVLRDDNGRAIFDRQLHSGTLCHIGVLEGISDVSTCLREIADEVDSRHGVPVRAAGPGAPGGDGGRLTAHRPGRVCASDCSLCGQHLDGMPSDD